MLRKNLGIRIRDPDSESGTEIADSGFLIIYEKPVDSGFGLHPCIEHKYLANQQQDYDI